MNPIKIYFSHLLAATALILTFATAAEARSPAVDPVQGISIDQYKDVPPEENKGSYEFRERPKSQKTNETITKESEPTPSKQNLQAETRTRQVASPTQETDWPLGFLLVALLALPFGIWWIFQKNLKDHQAPPPADNTVDLNQHRKRREESHDDYPKAS